MGRRTGPRLCRRGGRSSVWPRGAGPVLGLGEGVSLRLRASFCESTFGVSRSPRLPPPSQTPATGTRPRGADSGPFGSVLASPGCSAQGLMGPVRLGPHSLVTLPEASPRAGGDSGWWCDSQRVAVAARALTVTAGRVLRNVRVDEPRFSRGTFQTFPATLQEEDRGLWRFQIGGGQHSAPFVLVMVMGLVFQESPLFNSSIDV